jgi:hypothetical protein
MKRSTISSIPTSLAGSKEMFPLFIRDHTDIRFQKAGFSYFLMNVGLAAQQGLTMTNATTKSVAEY